MSDCKDYLPRSCAEAFARLERGQGRLEKLTAGIHENVAATAARVETLAEQSTRRREAIAALQSELAGLQREGSRRQRALDATLSAGWRLAVLLASLIASIMGLRNIFNLKG